MAGKRWIGWGLCAATLAARAGAQEQLCFSPGEVVSERTAVPGGAASKAKLLRLTKTQAAARDGRLLLVYTDAAHDGEVWSPRGGVHKPQDVFARVSDDDGESWSPAVNLSNSARSWSALTDWDGDGAPEEYWGDSSKASVFSSGDHVVVTWTDKYCPQEAWTFGDSGVSAVQGRSVYAEDGSPPVDHEVPYSGVFAAISTDGGTTWSFGDQAPPLQLTYGRRDAIQEGARGSGQRWVMTWQEDPAGLQPGEAEGPGDGASGAMVSKGTDIWYAHTTDLVQGASALRDTRTPLSDHSRYDTTATDGYPMVGAPGSIEKHGASRSQRGLLNDQGVFRALVAYEETKGEGDANKGKTVLYHAFPFDAPPQNGAPDDRAGVAGTLLSDPLESARRVRFVQQGPTGNRPALAIFWRQGPAFEGSPSDILLKASVSVDEADVLAAATLNLSSDTPRAGPTNLTDPVSRYPRENARAHRAVLDGDFLAVGYCYTPDDQRARFTTEENYEFWLRRSFDGGQTWLDPQNVSRLTTKALNVFEPRMVMPAKTSQYLPGVFVVAWSTQTNVVEGQEEAVALDLWATRTRDAGETFEALVPLAVRGARESECQLRVDDAAGEVYAVYMRAAEGGPSQAVYAQGRAVRAPRSTAALLCLGNGLGAPCPCGNESAESSAQGCRNSTVAGARLVARGGEGVERAGLMLVTSHLPPRTWAALLVADGLVLGGEGVVWGDGLLCVGGSVSWLGPRKADEHGVAVWGPGLGNTGLLPPGEARFLQALYRDPHAGPCGSTFNLSNAVVAY